MQRKKQEKKKKKQEANPLIFELNSPRKHIAKVLKKPVGIALPTGFVFLAFASVRKRCFSPIPLFGMRVALEADAVCNHVSRYRRA